MMISMMVILKITIIMMVDKWIKMRVKVMMMMMMMMMMMIIVTLSIKSSDRYIRSVFRLWKIIRNYLMPVHIDILSIETI